MGKRVIIRENEYVNHFWFNFLYIVALLLFFSFIVRGFDFTDTFDIILYIISLISIPFMIINGLSHPGFELKEKEVEIEEIRR